jgi:hypothetical protein
LPSRKNEEEIMEALLEHIDLIVFVIVGAMGYADIRKTVKDVIPRLEKFESNISHVLERLEANDKLDAVRDEKLSSLTAFKNETNYSMRGALQDIAVIKNEIIALREAIVSALDRIGK